MAKFKKGESGNPGGRPRLPDDLKTIQQLTADEYNRRIAKHLRMDRTELDAVLNNPATIIFDLIIAKTLQKSAEHGDINKAEYLFSRTLGKPKETMEVMQPPPMVIERTDGSQTILGVKVEEE